jgi:hypothetical protein
VTRQSLDDYLRATGRRLGQCLFQGRPGPDQHLTTPQYARLVSQWVSSRGLDPLKYATHSMRRTKATLTYRRTGNIRAVQLLLGLPTSCPRTGGVGWRSQAVESTRSTPRGPHAARMLSVPALCKDIVLIVRPGKELQLGAQVIRI